MIAKKHYHVLNGTSLTFEKFGNQFVVYFEKAKTVFSARRGRCIDQESGEPISYANIHIPHLNIGDISNQMEFSRTQSIKGFMHTDSIVHWI